MLPSSFTSHQELTPSSGAAYVYLLVSRQHPGSFKLGITQQPAMRFTTLTQRFGEFNLQASSLVVARSRRAALDLESILQGVFAPVWRAEPPSSPSKRARLPRSNGDTEWYRLEAFELMGSFVAGMIEQDQNCAFHRFALLRNIQDSDLWQTHLCQAGQTRFRPVRDVEREAQQRLAQSEANFAALQGWMEQRRHLLTSATPLTYDDQGNRRWTFVYRAEAASGFALAEASVDVWQALASACVISHSTKHGHRSFTYLGEVSASAAESTYSVEFLLTPAFTEASIEHPALRDLLARIVGWLEAPSLPQ